jgi:hypothetical protein
MILIKKCRYCFWLKAMRGEENCKFLCADSEADMLKLMAAIVQAKVVMCIHPVILLILITIVHFPCSIPTDCKHRYYQSNLLQNGYHHQ